MFHQPSLAQRLALYRGRGATQSQVVETVLALAVTAISISRIVGKGGIAGNLAGAAGAVSDGDKHKSLDLIANTMILDALSCSPVAGQNYRFSAEASDAFRSYIAARKAQPLFSNARSIRNALDRARLRQANRLVADLDRRLGAETIMTLEPEDILASRVFAQAAT